MVWMLLGLAIYFGYGYANSNLSAGENRKPVGLASLGFSVSALGLGISSFSFISDFLIYLFPSFTKDLIWRFEIGMFLVGLVVGIVGVVMSLNRKN